MSTTMRFSRLLAGAVVAVGLSSPTRAQEAALPAEGAEQLIRNVEQQRQVVEQFLTGRVQDALAKSRTDMRTNPQGAIDLLKQALQAVVSTPEISADVRQQLRNQVENALRQAANVQTVNEVEDVAIRRAQAEAEERKRLVEGLRQKDERLKAIMSRFEYLMAEDQFRAAEDLANLARREAPEMQAANLGSEYANLKGNFVEFMAVREQRWRNFAAALLSTERSSVPFPDEPPLIYPDPEVWARLTERRKQYAAVDLADQGPAEKRIRSALDNPARMEFIETPLNDVIEFLKDEHEVPIQLDKKALEDEGVDSATPITMNLAGVSFRSAMRLMLDPLGLTYVIKNEVMLITTKVKAEEDLIAKVYPVADLVIPIETPPIGSMGLNGAMGGGGQFGAAGGANGGGGMGGMGGGGGMGMGGGMGGMGGGGGGGFFNVAPGQGAQGGFMKGDASKELIELIEKVIAPNTWDAVGGPGAIKYHQPTKSLIIRASGETHDKIGNLNGALRAFNVKDDVAKPVAQGEAAAPEAPKAAEAEAVKGEAKPAEETKKIVLKETELKVPAGDPEVGWNDVFATRQIAEAAVRQTSRKLFEKKEFEQVIALINAALRNGQGQPWMHEVLGLALQASGRAQDEVERTLMSAIDLQEPNPMNLMFAARYLAASGSEARALKLYRQAGMLAPTMSEPYTYSLELAQRLGDIDGIKWAATGILSRAWPQKMSELSQRANGAATNALAQLRAGKRFREAEQFEKAVVDAMRRDIMVLVSWTGEADVDLAVEEPSGTMCSHRQQMTTSGGVLVGDMYAQQGAKSTRMVTETYICPQAFDGKYRMRLRRVWGDLTAKKVSVDIYTHYGSDKSRHIRRQIPLGDEDSVVIFDLENGRRQEQLAEHLVINAAQQQVAARRDMLVQQLDSLAEASPVKKLLGVRNRQFAAGRAQQNNVPGTPGYQPVIIVLSEGAQMSAQAVISADRRYVRFTGVPLFTGIGDVTTFDIGTGATTTQPFNGPGAGNGQIGGGQGGNGGGNGGGGNNGGNGAACGDGIPLPPAAVGIYVIPTSSTISNPPLNTCPATRGLQQTVRCNDQANTLLFPQPGGPAGGYNFNTINATSGAIGTAGVAACPQAFPAGTVPVTGAVLPANYMLLVLPGANPNNGVGTAFVFVPGQASLLPGTYAIPQGSLIVWSGQVDPLLRLVQAYRPNVAPPGGIINQALDFPAGGTLIINP